MEGKLAECGGSDGVFSCSAAAAALWIQTIFSFSSSRELSLNHPCNDTTYFCMFIWMCEKQRIFRFFHSLFLHPLYTRCEERESIWRRFKLFFFPLVSTLKSTVGRIQFTKRAHREWLMIVLQIYSLELYNWYHHCLSFQNI